ncbi:MAG: tryptophan 2,3-dioxygenase family protein [Acidobacteriota bacterium]
MSESDSVLEGKGRTDYEKYLNIVDLLACQKSPEDLVHHDELMFQIAHQTAELWMKLEIHELTKARELIDKEDCLKAASLLRRVIEIHKILIHQLPILENLSPWDYQTIRRILGKGSGLESPGFQTLVVLGPTLWAPFADLVKKRGITVDQVFTEKEDHYPLFLLAEALAGVDEQFQIWRFNHLKLVEREIGGKVMSLKGRAIDFLSENMQQRFFPELWEVRNRLTRRAGTSY